MTTPCPVIVCDVCGTATPARFLSHAGHPEVTEEERVADLVGQGWSFRDGRDVCPRCTGL